MPQWYKDVAALTMDGERSYRRKTEMRTGHSNGARKQREPWIEQATRTAPETSGHCNHERSEEYQNMTGGGRDKAVGHSWLNVVLTVGDEPSDMHARRHGSTSLDTNMETLRTEDDGQPTVQQCTEPIEHSLTAARVFAHIMRQEDSDNQPSSRILQAHRYGQRQRHDHHFHDQTSTRYTINTMPSPDWQDTSAQELRSEVPLPCRSSNCWYAHVLQRVWAGDVSEDVTVVAHSAGRCHLLEELAKTVRDRHSGMKVLVTCECDERQVRTDII
eukprot:GHVQ01000433.1.p1 GENE.GHVQ01000433.1~~GHVQ01000433.1.p1  ORF type:complete len:273 (-),score=32.29 GHVQ01000433.1:1100-1918(-)